MLTYMGKRVYSSPHLVEQFRFPKTKGKRVRKKWRNRSENFRPMNKAIVTEAGIFLHPLYFRKLAETIKRADRGGENHGN